MDLHEKNKPTSPELWDRAISKAKSKFDVYPSAYANAWAAKEYKRMGGEWTTESYDPVLESVVDKMTGDIAKSIKNEIKRKAGEGTSVKDYVTKAHEAVEIAEQKFSQSMINKMRKEYGNLGTIDPSQPTYKKLTALLDKLSDVQLQQLAKAKIKFVSGLALNRVNRRKMQKESVELDEANAKEYKMDAPDNIKKAIEGGKAKILKTAPSYLGGKSVFAVIENPSAKGSQHDPVVMAIISDPSRGKIKLFRYFGSHASPTGAMKFAKNNDLLESVELDELKMPKKNERGRIIDPTVRAAVKRGYHRADTKADVALRGGDVEGAEGPMARARKRKIASRTEEVELDEVTRTAFKGGDRATNEFQRKLKEMGMAQEYMKMVRLLKKKGSGFGLFMKEEDRGEEYASKTGIGPSLGFSIEKVNGEKLGSEDVQKRGDTTYKKTLVAMNESVMTESINPKDIDPTGYYSFYSNSSRNIYNITGPYSSEKEAYRDGRGDLDNILTGTELIKRLKKGEYKKWSLHIRKSVELGEVLDTKDRVDRYLAARGKRDQSDTLDHIRGKTSPKDYRRQMRNSTRGKLAASLRRARHTEEVELGEANMPKFDEVLRKGKKLGDWNMMSYFLYDGNVWMLKSGRAVNQGPVEQFKKKVQPGLLKSLKFESVDIEEDWQSVNRKDNVDGLSQKAVDAYRRENPGSKLQTAVTEKNPKGKRAERRASFCSRMKGMKSKLTSAETANDPDSRINKALRRWNCR